MTTWYRTGTVNVTLNGVNVVGVGTAFLENVKIGDEFNGPDGRSYEITNVATNTSITLATTYKGATASGQAYQIKPTQGWARWAALKLAELMSKIGDAIQKATGALQIEQYFGEYDTSAKKALARAGLELGTAASANVTTSPHDVSQESLMRVADYRDYILDCAVAKYRKYEIAEMTIRIRLPYKITSNAMIAFTVRVYAGYHVTDYRFSGYLYDTYWYQPIVTVSGSLNAPVNPTFGIDGHGFAYVSIKSGSYRTVTVGDVVVGGVVSVVASSDWVLSNEEDDGVIAHGKLIQTYTTNNTTVDANGFIKEASPVVRLFNGHLNKTDHLELANIALIRIGVGHYELHNAPLLSRDGWYIETPKDRNGNVYFTLDYEEHDGVLTIRTYTPDYSEGPAQNGEPVDILEGRFVSLRFAEDPSLYPEPEPEPEPDDQNEFEEPAAE